MCDECLGMWEGHTEDIDLLGEASVDEMLEEWKRWHRPLTRMEKAIAELMLKFVQEKPFLTRYAEAKELPEEGKSKIKFRRYAPMPNFEQETKSHKIKQQEPYEKIEFPNGGTALRAKLTEEEEEE